MSPQVSFNRLPLDDDVRLRDLVVECAHNLEPDLRVAGGLLPIGGSRTLDLVAVDSQSRLVLLEVCCRESAGWLLEGVDHYDWAREHIDELVQLYPQHRIDAGRLARLVFITAAFSDEFRRRLLYFEPLRAELVEFRYLEVNGVRGLYFEPIGLPALRALSHPTTLQMHLDAMVGAERAAMAEALVARVASLDPGVRLLVHRGGLLALWEERLLARLDFQRGGVWVSDEDLDAGTEIRRPADLEPVLTRLAVRVSRWRRLQRPAPVRAAARPAAPSSGASSRAHEGIGGAHARPAGSPPPGRARASAVPALEEPALEPESSTSARPAPAGRDPSRN